MSFSSRLDLDVRDIVLFIGIVLLAGGCGWIYLPLAAIVPGLICVWQALAPPRSTKRQRATNA